MATSSCRPVSVSVSAICPEWREKGTGTNISPELYRARTKTMLVRASTGRAGAARSQRQRGFLAAAMQPGGGRQRMAGQAKAKQSKVPVRQGKSRRVDDGSGLVVAPGRLQRIWARGAAPGATVDRNEARRGEATGMGQGEEPGRRRAADEADWTLQAGVCSVGEELAGCE